MENNQYYINQWFELENFSVQSKNTRKSALNYFFTFTNNKPIAQLKIIDIENYFASLLKNPTLTKDTKRTKFAILQAFLNWYMYINQKPLWVLKKKRDWSKGTNKQSNGNRNIIATIPELEQILTHFKYRNHKHYLIFRLLIETGMRKGELIQLETKDIHIKERYLYTTGKTGRKLYCFSQELASLLEHYIKNRLNYDSPHPNLFLTVNGKVFSLRPFNLFLKQALTQLNINKPLTCNSFRKTINSLRDKINTPQVRKELLLGHKASGVNIANYTIIDIERHVEIYDKYNPYKDAIF
jgi:integrase